MTSESFNIETYDGVTLDAVLTRPVGDAQSDRTIVMAHGITVDLNEGGMFKRLADQLASDGWTVLRFSFRGHGASTGTQRGVTVAGETIDLECAVSAFRDRIGFDPQVVLGSSFGAVSTGLLTPLLLRRGLRAIVLWNPVLDVAGTFVAARTPWAAENFTPENLDQLEGDGYMMLDGTFTVGFALASEMAHVDARPHFVEADIPLLVVHGDQDQSVAYAESQRLVELASNAQLKTIVGSDHGFSGSDFVDQAIASTREWLSAL
jgi:pimeloyl-ACP methyl ester carboxylesterase